MTVLSGGVTVVSSIDTVYLEPGHEIRHHRSLPDGP